MPYAFFLIPADATPAAASALNTFLASKSVTRVTREWCSDRGTGAWAFSVEYQDDGAVPGTLGTSPGRPDYKAMLPAEQFAKFSQLRDMRVSLATRHNVAPFVVFTNAQLVQMVKKGCRTLEDLKGIHGIGEERLTKYAPAILDILKGTIGADGEAAPGADAGKEEEG